MSAAHQLHARFLRLRFAVAAFLKAFLGPGSEMNRPLLLDRAVHFPDFVLPGYKTAQSSSEGTNVSSSRSMASLIAVFSSGEFLSTVNFRDIAINLPIVGLSQTYDAQSGFANRKYHSMKSVAYNRIGKYAAFGIVASKIRKVAGAVPLQILDLLEIDTVKVAVRDTFSLVPVANQHTNNLRLNSNQEVYT